MFHELSQCRLLEKKAIFLFIYLLRYHFKHGGRACMRSSAVEKEQDLESNLKILVKARVGDRIAKSHSLEVGNLVSWFAHSSPVQVIRISSGHPSQDSLLQITQSPFYFRNRIFISSYGGHFTNKYRSSLRFHLPAKWNPV